MAVCRPNLIQESNPSHVKFLPGSELPGALPWPVSYVTNMSYQLHWFHQRIPVAYPQGPDGPTKVKVISGKSHNIESPVRPLGGCWFFHISFDGEGEFFQDLREHAAHVIWQILMLRFFGQQVDGLRFYIVSSSIFDQKEIFKDTLLCLAWKGSVRVGSDTAAIPAFHTAILSADPEQTGVALSGSLNTELVLVIFPFNLIFSCCWKNYRLLASHWIRPFINTVLSSWLQERRSRKLWSIASLNLVFVVVRLNWPWIPQIKLERMALRRRILGRAKLRRNDSWWDRGTIRENL